jgi:hypothetical protein
VKRGGFEGISDISDQISGGGDQRPAIHDQEAGEERRWRSRVRAHPFCKKAQKEWGTLKYVSDLAEGRKPKKAIGRSAFPG